MDKLLITENFNSNGKKEWLLNIDKFNNETDVVIPEMLAKIILLFKSSTK